MKYIAKREIHTDTGVILEGEIIDEKRATTLMKELCLVVPFKHEMLTDDSSNIQVKTEETTKTTKTQEKEEKSCKKTKEEKDE